MYLLGIMSYSTTKLLARDKVVVSQLYKPSHMYLHTYTWHLSVDPMAQQPFVTEMQIMSSVSIHNVQKKGCNSPSCI